MFLTTFIVHLFKYLDNLILLHFTFSSLSAFHVFKRTQLGFYYNLHSRMGSGDKKKAWVCFLFFSERKLDMKLKQNRGRSWKPAFFSFNLWLWNTYRSTHFFFKFFRFGSNLPVYIFIYYFHFSLWFSLQHTESNQTMFLHELLWPRIQAPISSKFYIVL